MATRRCKSGDPIVGLDVLGGLSIDAFWAWAYGDLCDDDVKGAFAEWLVAQLLGLSHPRRVAGTMSDLIADGVRIEVKSTSYWQSWKYLNEDGSSRVQERDKLDTAPSAVKVRFGRVKPHSDLYVFCLQHELDLAKWNALDISQWEFYALRKGEIGFPTQGGKEISITLDTLRKAKKPLTASGLVQSGRTLLDELKAGRPA